MPLPADAAWLVGAPEAGRFARDVSVMLDQAARQTPVMSAHRVGGQFQHFYALPLVDAEALGAAGVDLSQPWIVFERGGARYLSVGVHDPHALAATIDHWAGARGLAAREEQKASQAGNATAVTFAHAPGTRPATGYLIARGHAVILLKPADRDPALGASWRAIDEAAPVEPPVHGALLAWLGPESAFKDAWAAYTFRPDGVDLSGAARKVAPGWLVRDRARGDWIRDLTGSSDASLGLHPAWGRVSAGPKAAAALFDSLAPLVDESDGSTGRWLHGLHTVSAGPIEAIARTVDISPLQSASSDNILSDLVAVTQPEVLLVDRPAAAISDRIGDALAQLCKSTREGDVVRAGCTGPRVTVARLGQTLGIAWGGSGKPPDSVAIAVAPPTLTCTRGMPVAAARVELAAVFQGTRQVGLLDALSSDTLAGIYAVMLEYGPFLKAARPAVALVCQEPSGRVSVEGHWRFGPR
jgi:hypothetical protein